MKHYILTEHSVFCEIKEWCSNHPELLIFYANNDFYLVQYPRCNECLGHLDFKQRIVKQFYEQVHSKDFFDVTRYRLDDVFKSEFNLQKYMKIKCYDINYIYLDSRKRKYCICSKRDYIEKWLDVEQLEENFNNAIKWINDNKNEFNLNFNYAKEEIEQLYQYNSIYGYDEKKIINRTNDILNLINQEIT